MKSVRERFEEIWPVPDVIMWSEYIGRYIPMPDEVLQYERLNEQWAHEHNARLDTFTRCQETAFSKEELNLFRQWFNAVEDLNPAYLEKSDCDLYSKVMEMMK